MNRSFKDGILRSFIYASTAFTVGILVIIIGYIFSQGIPYINVDFLTRDYNAKTTYVTSSLNDTNAAGNASIDRLLINVEPSDNGLKVISVPKESPMKQTKDLQNNPFKIKKGDLILKIGDLSTRGNTDSSTIAEANKLLNGLSDQDVQIKVVRPGGGIVPMLVTTLFMIVLSLLIAGPIGILAAIYLNEYSKSGRIIEIIRFAIQNLAGIPSIIYGLFGSVFFVQVCNMKYSLLAGALTISLILLPTIISTTEEALKSIPKGYRESSLGLGATKLQTISKVILPNALSGILVAVILSIGRVVGESAALLLTAGTVAQIPSALIGQRASGATLTIKAYTALKEEGDIAQACAIGVILILLIAGINILSKWISKRYTKKRNA